MKNRLPPLVIALGFVSLFTDIASEMMVPVLPVFLTVTLGASATFVGLIEGVAEGVAAILKGLGGVWSDAGQTRRKWILGGYGISTLARPLIALSSPSRRLRGRSSPCAAPTAWARGCAPPRGMPSSPPRSHRSHADTPSGFTGPWTTVVP